MLKKFGMIDAKSVSTLIEIKNHLKNLSEDQADASRKEVPYQQAIGSLLFAACVSRLDIMFAVANVSKFSSNPSIEYWQAVKKILHYLKGTSNQGITYQFNGNNQLIGYCDADYANDEVTRKLMTGLTTILARGLIIRTSRRQSVMAQFTAEAEYIAAVDATKEMWIRELLKDVDAEQNNSTVLRIDKQAAIKLIRNPKLHRSKHIDVRFHLIRNHVEKNICIIMYQARNN